MKLECLRDFTSGGAKFWHGNVYIGERVEDGWLKVMDDCGRVVELPGNQPIPFNVLDEPELTEQDWGLIRELLQDEVDALEFVLNEDIGGESTKQITEQRLEVVRELQRKLN